MKKKDLALETGIGEESGHAPAVDMAPETVESADVTPSDTAPIEEEKDPKLDEYKTEAIALAQEYNDFFQNGQVTEFLKTEEKLKEVIDSYNELSQTNFFNACKATENPIVHAVTVLEYDIIGTSDTTDKDSKLKVKSIADRKKVVDLLKLEKHCGVIGADPNWRQKANELYCVCVIKGCSDVGKDPIELHGSENMRRLVKVFNLKKDGVTGKQLIKYTQPVVDAMLGEGYKVLTHDKNWISGDITKTSRKDALTKEVFKSNAYMGIVAQMCHHLVTGKPYNVIGKIKEF